MSESDWIQRVSWALLWNGTSCLSLNYPDGAAGVWAREMEVKEGRRGGDDPVDSCYYLTFRKRDADGLQARDG